MQPSQIKQAYFAELKRSVLVHKLITGSPISFGNETSSSYFWREAFLISLEFPSWGKDLFTKGSSVGSWLCEIFGFPNSSTDIAEGRVNHMTLVTSKISRAGKGIKPAENPCSGHSCFSFPDSTIPSQVQELIWNSIDVAKDDWSPFHILFRSRESGDLSL